MSPAAFDKFNVTVPALKEPPVIAIPAEDDAVLISTNDTVTGFDLFRKNPSRPNTSPAGIYFLLMSFWILKVVDVVRFQVQANLNQYS